MCETGLNTEFEHLTHLRSILGKKEKKLAFENIKLTLASVRKFLPNGHLTGSRSLDIHFIPVLFIVRTILISLSQTISAIERVSFPDAEKDTNGFSQVRGRAIPDQHQHSRPQLQIKPESVWRLYQTHLHNRLTNAFVVI